jgi:hypothetical protein
VAFVAHLAVDWDWELSGVALTGLFVGCLLLVAHRKREERPLAMELRGAGVVIGLVTAGFAFVGLVGNTALAHAQTANGHHRYADAIAEASTARGWMPWSPDPLKALGTARLERGDVSGAEKAFRAAISLDRNDWQSWLDLAASLHGRARTKAVGRARALYPRSPEIVEFEKEAKAQEAGH